ncbi:MAG: pyridoxal phosphate-dependent aminotransferase family protein [Bacteroidia bacterium]|nr:pyridoxal phosphate-dependent aminotransferase family protein [Bacteroidia bacterium]
MFSSEVFIKKAIDKRISENSLRKLQMKKNLIDFSSNDYLGFAKSVFITTEANQLLTINSLQNNNGATGSRLLSGNSNFIEKIEKQIAKTHKYNTALIFNSGYDANIGIFSSIPQRDDTILYDELIHASVHDGMRLSFAKNYSFSHNNVQRLEEELKKAKGTIFVAIESVYSMDGDIAPLKEITALCEKYSANLIVDEAHAIGVFGNGLVNKNKLEKKVFLTLYTYGKAMGAHGSAVCCSNLTRQFLVNFARSFIYTTALPAHSFAVIASAYEQLKNSEFEIEKLHQNISYFQTLAQQKKLNVLKSSSAIQSIIIPGIENVKKASEKLTKKGFDVRPILSPTVKKDTERLRICLHSYNTKNEIENLIQAVTKCIQ